MIEREYDTYISFFILFIIKNFKKVNNGNSWTFPKFDFDRMMLLYICLLLNQHQASIIIFDF